MDLLQSPCLHSLIMDFKPYRVTKTQVAVEGIFPLITMAPNLKHIELTEDVIGGINQTTEYNQFLDDYIKSNSSPQYLATPVFLRHQGYCFDSLKEWNKSTDFSSLGEFEFPNSFSPVPKFRIFISWSTKPSSNAIRSKLCKRSEFYVQ
ncbi:hypothetical protein TMatcc_002949 [Talaromyces marneffei ATCC 18224]